MRHGEAWPAHRGKGRRMAYSQPPGQLFDIGGGRLHAQILGEGAPAVVMDSGLGATSLLFAAVLPAVAEFTTAVAFDRAGYPWSDPAPPAPPRSSSQIVDELRRLLAAAQVPPPYVLVGLSFGAINMLTYARRFRSEVAGLVLVDPSHPQMWRRVPMVPGPGGMVSSLKFMRQLARWGLFRRFGRRLGPLLTVKPDRLPPAAADAYLAQIGDPAFYDAAIAEALSAEESFAGADLQPGELGDLPLLVLSAGDWTQGFPRAMKQAMLGLHAEMAAYAHQGEHRIVPDSSHAIPADQPQAVVDAISDVVTRLRGES